VAEYVVSLQDQVSRNAAQMTAQLGGLATAMRVVQQAAGGMTGAVRESTPALAEAAKAAQGVTPAATGAASATGLLPPQLMAVKAAALAVVGAIVAVAGALFVMMRAAVEFGEMRAGITASLEAFTGDGPAAVSMLDELGKRLPFTTERMAHWSTALASAGVRDLPSLQRGVTAAAAATALMRDATDGTATKVTNLVGKLREFAEEGKGEKFDTLTKKLKGIGVDVNDVAREMGTTADKLKGTTVDATKLGDAIQNALIHKGKGALEAFGDESTQIWAKFKENVSALFEDLAPDAKAFMAEVRGIADEFMRGSATSGVAKSAIGAVFHTLFDWATRATHAVHIAFLDVEIMALKAAIAVAPTAKAVQRFWATHAMSDKLLTALKGVAIILGVLAVGAAIAFSPIVIGAAAATAAVLGIAYAVGWVAGKIGSVGKTLKSWAASAYAAATDFISGLVSGIKAGVGRAVDAVKGLGSSVVGAIKGVLHIQSPSRVMAEVGLQTAQGMAVGIDQGQSDVARAASRLGGAAVSSSSSSSTTNNTRGGNVTLRAEVHVHNYGGGFEVLEGALDSTLQRLATQLLIPAAAA